MSGRRKLIAPAGVASLGELRASFPITDDELAGGRVFVGRTRASSFATPVAGGALVVVEGAIEAAGPEPSVLFEDEHLLALDKPATWVTIAEQRGDGRALVPWAERARPGYSLHATSRLDLGVSGVVTVAKTAAARDALARLRDEGRYGRAYLAIAEGAFAEPQGTWSAPIGRARDPKRRTVGGRDAKPAETRVVRVAIAPNGAATLLALFPVTGRTHQLRVHAAHAGHALLGDRDYGRGRPIVAPTGAVFALERVALHCHRVVLGAPLAHGLVSPLPDALAALWTSLGGATAELEAARDAATNHLPEPDPSDRRELAPITAPRDPSPRGDGPRSRTHVLDPRARRRK